MPYLNIIEALEFSDLKIASSNLTIIYIISFPTTNKESCETILIKPVKIKNFINKIKYENIIKCKR